MSTARDRASEVDLKADLLDWQARLHNAIQKTSTQVSDLQPLLREVEKALQRIDAGSYGICEICHEPMEGDLLKAPLTRICLEHLTSDEQRELEDDLELVGRVQNSLLPKFDASICGWDAFYHYEAARQASGDYCDLVRTGADEFLFFLGDVAGKGIASSLLMANLHAIFRSLTTLDLPVRELVERANLVFAGNTMPAYYATLLVGKANASGEVEIANAGHCRPLLFSPGNVRPIEPTGPPVGMFGHQEYGVHQFKLSEGEGFFLYTDGLSEASDSMGQEYGEGRLVELIAATESLTPRSLTDACLEDLKRFRQSARSMDDLTVMVLQRSSRVV